MSSIHSIGHSVAFTELNAVYGYNPDHFHKYCSFSLAVEGNADRIARMKILACTEPKLQGYYLIKVKEKKAQEPSTLYLISHHSLQIILKTFEQVRLANKENNAPLFLEKLKWIRLFSSLNAETNYYGDAVNAKKLELQRKINQASAFQKADALFDAIMNSTIDLVKEMELAGLSGEEIASLRSHAASVTDFKDFLLNAPNFREATIIGLNQCNIIPGFSESLQAREYGDAYEEFFGEFKNRPEFMSRLTAQNKPIIFLVPSQLMNHPKAGVTKKEMQWALQHPDKMSGIHFVFGAYEYVQKKKFQHIPYRDLGKAHRYMDDLTTRLFSRIKQVHGSALDVYEKENESELQEEMDDFLFIPFPLPASRGSSNSTSTTPIVVEEVD